MKDVSSFSFAEILDMATKEQAEIFENWWEVLFAILRNLVVGRAHEPCLIHQQALGINSFFFPDHKNHPASLVTVEPSKVSTLTGIVEIGIQKPRNCRRFWTPDSLLNLKSVNSHRDREGQGRDTPNCRPFWALGSSWSLRSSNSHGDRVLACIPRMP